MAILSKEETLRRRAATRELAAALMEDLSYYREVLARPEQSPAELRRLSGSLRRVLLDEGIAIAASPRIAKLKLRVPDNHAPYDTFNAHNCRSFMSLGVPAFGIIFRGAADAAVELSAFNPDAIAHASLDGYLSQKVIFYGGRWISRRAVLKYVAYIKHGIHSGTPIAKDVDDTNTLNLARRSLHMKMRDGIPGMFFNPSPTEPFDQDQFTYDPDAVDCVLLELLAAIQYVVESEDVHRLEAFIRGELGAV